MTKSSLEIFPISNLKRRRGKEEPEDLRNPGYIILELGSQLTVHFSFIEDGKVTSLSIIANQPGQVGVYMKNDVDIVCIGVALLAFTREIVMFEI